MKLFTFFFLSIFFIISLFIGEFYLKHIGLGNPISYDSDLIYGYAPKVNQKKNRLKSSTVTINEVGLRSLENWSSSDKSKILFIGDSITYGGSYIDDRKIFSHLVCEELKNFVCGNAGVNAYSIVNMVMRLRYDERIHDSDIIIITVAPGDFYREYADSGTAHFYLNENKLLFPAIMETISFFATKYDLNRYLSKKNSTKKYNHKNELIEFSINLLKEEVKNQSKEKKIIVLYTVERQDKESKNDINKKIKMMLENNFEGFLFNLSETLYDDKFFYDGVHYNELGHLAVSKKIIEILKNF